jgi:hypothetical protein
VPNAFCALELPVYSLRLTLYSTFNEVCLRWKRREMLRPLNCCCCTELRRNICSASQTLWRAWMGPRVFQLISHWASDEVVSGKHPTDSLSAAMQNKISRPCVHHYFLRLDSWFNQLLLLSCLSYRASSDSLIVNQKLEKTQKEIVSPYFRVPPAFVWKYRIASLRAVKTTLLFWIKCRSVKFSTAMFRNICIGSWLETLLLLHFVL